jgi:ferredoxin
MMRIRVDSTKCQGHSRCYAIAPDLFDIDDYGTSTARNGGEVPADREDAARLAVRNCPEHAIGIVSR